MTKAQEARDRLRVRIEAVLRQKGGYEVGPYLESVAIEQWIYGDPEFLAALIEENDLSPEAATFVAEIVRGAVAPVALGAASKVQPGAALFAVVWAIAHRDMRETIAVEKAATDLGVSQSLVWDAIQSFEPEDIQKALQVVASATETDLRDVIRNARRPPVFGGMIWLPTKTEV